MFPCSLHSLIVHGLPVLAHFILTINFNVFTGPSSVCVCLSNSLQSMVRNENWLHLYSCCRQKYPDCVVIHRVKINISIDVANDSDYLLIFFRNISPQQCMWVLHQHFLNAPLKRQQKSKTFNFVNLPSNLRLWRELGIRARSQVMSKYEKIVKMWGGSRDLLFRG